MGFILGVGIGATAAMLWSLDSLLATVAGIGAGIGLVLGSFLGGYTERGDSSQETGE